jgi:hypothetical protein
MLSDRFDPSWPDGRSTTFCQILEQSNWIQFPLHPSKTGACSIRELFVSLSPGRLRLKFCTDAFGKDQMSLKSDDYKKQS